MDFLEYLRNVISNKEQRANELRQSIIDATTADEVRALGDTLDAVLKELEDAKKQLATAEEPSPNEEKEGENQRGKTPNESRFFNPLATYGNGNNSLEGIGDSIEYRTAFMNFVLRDVPIPAELRNENTKTSDVSSVIPTMLVNKIIEKFDNVGMILPLVEKTSYASGVEIPTSSVKPVATWTGRNTSNKSQSTSGEGLGSSKQKKSTGKISFTYFKLRCEISVSMEVGTMALSAFEAKFIENVSKAMVKAMEDSIINGDGYGQPTGILSKDAPDGQTISVGATDKLSYQVLVDAEAAVPDEYENTAKWCMSKKSFMAFAAMTDDSGQPIGRVNYGINGKIERTLLGRDVVLASAYMPNYSASVSVDTTFAFIFDFSDYVLNTIYDMGIQKKQDWDTEDLLTKAVMSVDGKPVTVDSLVKVKKLKASE